MSDASDFDFPMSRTFRDGLPVAIDYHTSGTFAGPASRSGTTAPRFHDQEIDDLHLQIRGLRSDRDYWRQRATLAEIAAQRWEQRAAHFEGVEEPEQQ